MNTSSEPYTDLLLAITERMGNMDPIGAQTRPPAPEPSLEIQDDVPVRRKKYGTREDVWAGTALMTKGGLQKHDLKAVPTGMNKATGEIYQKIVSVKRSEMAKELFRNNPQMCAKRCPDA